MAAHPELSGLWERKAKQPAIGNAAFIDKNACRNYPVKARAWLAQTRADDAAAARTGASVTVSAGTPAGTYAVLSR